ncbi:FAD-binding oxidoreductase [Candidatus Methylacidithermus pantelleriae]|uniref:FAD/FMN-containing dehydrogenase n=1 Tax=Candidatus Methylacidithermus pantelleriae TaxID=2744239 RepID=A0A8J2BSC7_9BACT|nr:FAD-linked oxidase C-terminal domain-containing protein [Candidatus Methylacidithermus pantelleriae]CAF0703876.1 FAD/FMN-containing dehydrogenase [Candidatus Methylacidithermus pantelleriae]
MDTGETRSQKAGWIFQLEKLLPLGRVSCEPQVLAEHGTDAWLARALPEAVVFPRTVEEVSAVLRFAWERDIPVTARGAGRGYVGGCVPVRGGIVLSVAYMNRIREIDPVDGVAVVEPGVITGKLAQEARRLGYFYPPDPASLHESSIGGNIATNAGGARSLKYGVTKHYVLGLEVVLAEGTIVRVGSRTHKNKTGFDLVSLFVGSEGLLGVVTEATLRLIPHPPARAVIAAGFEAIERAAAAVENILTSGLLPSALEIADRFTVEAARHYLTDVSLPPGQAHLLVEVDGGPQAVREEGERVSQILLEAGAIAVESAWEEDSCERLWSTRRSFSRALSHQGLLKLNEDVTVPRSRLVDLFSFVSELARRWGIPIAAFGHAGDGNIHVNLMVNPNQEEEKTRAQRALDELFAQVLGWGGVLTGEHGIGLAKLSWWPQAVSEPVREIHRKIKRALDPKGMLNPGKFV